MVTPILYVIDLNVVKRGLEDEVTCLHLGVSCSTVAASVADSHTPRGSCAESGLPDWPLSQVLQQGAAPADCLTGAGI